VFSVEGYHRESEGVVATTADGRPTTKTNVGVDQGIARGVLSWTRVDDFSSLGWAPDGDYDTDDPEMLLIDEMLDSRTAEIDKEWMVDAQRRLIQYDPSTTVDWIVPPGIVAMGTATDERIDRVFLTYRDSDDNDHRRLVSYPATTPISGVEARAAVDRKHPITQAKADSYAETIYKRVNGGKDGWTNGVTLSPGQLLTPGGQYANPSHVRGNHKVRLLGIPDPRDGVAGDTTFHIDTVAWDVTAQSLQLNPIGLADRSFESIARRVLPKPKKDRSTRAHGGSGWL
jgi:hypothetical protein